MDTGQKKRFTGTTDNNLQESRRLFSTLIEVLKTSWIGILVGLLGTVGFIFLFALLTDEVFDKELVGLDTNLALWSYDLANPALTLFFTIITDIGSPVGIGVLTAITFGLLMWRKLYLLAWLGLILIVGSALVDEILKQIFRRARPELLAGGQHLSSYSFPSGHATGSICFFGFLIWLSWQLLKKPIHKVLLTILLVLMILLVGFSRIYLGVHYPTDVLGGYLAGGAWLIIVLSSYHIFHRYRNSLPPKSGSKPR